MLAASFLLPKDKSPKCNTKSSSFTILFQFKQIKSVQFLGLLQNSSIFQCKKCVSEITNVFNTLLQSNISDSLNLCPLSL